MRDRVTYLGYANARSKRTRFGIKQHDRLSHCWIVGKTGVGKSTLLKSVAVQDLETEVGFLLLDPHGDLVKEVATHAETISREVLHFNPAEEGWSLNPFAGVAPSLRPLAVAGLVETFKKLWPKEWGPRLENILRNVAWTLTEAKEATLLDVPRLLSDRHFRGRIVERLENRSVVDFWRYEFARWTSGFRSMALAPLENKIGAILGDPRLRRLFGPGGRPLRLREAMDRGDVVLADLSKGVLGEGPSDLVGSLLLSRLALAALSRAEAVKYERQPFWVIADEFQSFGTEYVATMLGELRKYGVGMVAANQRSSQLTPEVRDALLGNCGTVIVFRVGSADGRLFASEFSPVFAPDDFLTLPNFSFYLRLLIDGQPSKAFSAQLSREAL